MPPLAISFPFREMLVVASLVATYAACVGWLWWRLTESHDTRRNDKQPK